MSDDAATTEGRVPGFLYLDMDRVKSISSRMDEGYTQERIEEEEENSEIASSLTSSVKARILGIGSGSVGGTVEGRSGSASITGETRALHHYYVPLLEAWLEESGSEWFHDINSLLNEIDGSYAERTARNKIASSVSKGDIIRVQGDMELLDFSTSLDFTQGMLSAFDKVDSTLRESSEKGTDGNTGTAADSEVFREDLLDDDHQSDDLSAADIFGIGPDDLDAIRLMFDMFHDVMPSEYENMVVTQVFPPIGESLFWFWGLIQRNKLDTDPVELLSKYETSEIPNCTVLARVETITEKQDDDQDDDSNDDTVDFGTLHHFSDAIASDFGFKVSYPAISISPIVIYR